MLSLPIQTTEQAISSCNKPPAELAMSQTRHRASTSTCWHFTFALCCHGNATRAPIANPPNSAQLGSMPYHTPKLHLGPCSSVGIRPRTDTDRHTDAHDHYTFCIVYDFTKCNYYKKPSYRWGTARRGRASWNLVKFCTNVDDLYLKSSETRLLPIRL